MICKILNKLTFKLLITVKLYCRPAQSKYRKCWNSYYRLLQGPVLIILWATLRRSHVNTVGLPSTIISSNYSN